MKFLNEEHQANFEEVKAIGHRYNDDVGYNRAMLLLTLPFVYPKFSTGFKNYEEDGSPLDVVFDLLMAEDDSKGIDLTSSMKLLSKMALNLFNGYGEVSVYEMINTVEERYIDVVVDAIRLKKDEL